MNSKPPASSPSMASPLSSLEPSASFSAAENPAIPRSSSDQEPANADISSDHSITYRWAIPNFPKTKAKSIDSPHFKVGGFDYRLVIYPKGESVALLGHSSFYIEITDPQMPTFGCYARFRVTILNHNDDSRSFYQDSCGRFSANRRSHGWLSFVPSSRILDPESEFLFNNSLVIIVDVFVLNEYVSFSPNNIEMSSASSGSVSSLSGSDNLSGNLKWKIRNFSLFKEMLSNQNLVSPVFQAGDCNLCISVFQSTVHGFEFLSVSLKSKDTGGQVLHDRSCWCLFKLSVLNKEPEFHRQMDFCGRFGANGNFWDYRSIGENYLEMSDFIRSENGFLVDDTVVFSVSFYTIKESVDLIKNTGFLVGKSALVARKWDKCSGKFTWRIENFTRLKDLLKKRKMEGILVKSKRFQIEDHGFRLLVYPKGQSQASCYLSVYLEVMDPLLASWEWSCFVNYRLSVVNQRVEGKSVIKESQNRYSRSVKEGGWHEFMNLGCLFDQSSGFVIQDTVVFSAEILILKETFLMQDFTESGDRTFQVDPDRKRVSFTWKVENFLSFKETLSTEKLFSKFFQVDGCEFRIGFYESSSTICAYLECDPSAVSDLDKNFWVSYRMAVVNQKDPAKSLWKQSSLCTKTCNNSALQLMKASDMLKADAGFIVREMAVFVCEILDYCPWFEFSELEVLVSDEDALSTEPDELSDTKDSNVISGNNVDAFKNLLVRAGNLTYGVNTPQLLVTITEKLQMEIGAIAGLLIGLHLYLDDPVKIKDLLLLNSNDGKQEATSTYESSSSLMNMMMGVKVLQRIIDDVLLDIMVECCRPSKGRSSEASYDASTKLSLYTNGAVYQSESRREIGAADSLLSLVYKRLEHCQSVQCSGVDRTDKPKKAILAQQAFKTKWPEPSEELLGMIVNSLKILKGTVPQGCQEPRQKTQFVEKISIVLCKAPTHLQLDLVTLVPKLIDRSEHPLAASTFLDQLKKPKAEPALRPPVLAAIIQLDFGSETWERLLYQASTLLQESNNEPLAAAIGFVFTAATQCQHFRQAVRFVNSSLRSLGAEVSQSVLNLLCKTVNGWDEIAEAMLIDIDFVFELDEKVLTNPGGASLYGEDGPATKRLHLIDEQHLCANSHFSDIYILIEMWTIPSRADKASQVFKRGVAHGFIVDHLVSKVLERRLAQRSSVDSISYAEKYQHKDIAGEGNIVSSLPVQEFDFTLLLGLAETLSLSRNSQVHWFVKKLYAILFRLFADDAYQREMLKRLVGRATSPADDHFNIAMDILVFLVGEQGILARVLGMMREVAELANFNLGRENAVLLENLREFEAAANRFKIERDCSAREKEELLERIQEVENQLEERDDIIANLSMEKKVHQDRLHDVETQLSLLKSNKHHELKKIVEVKNALAESLREAEALRKSFDEVKRFVASKEEVIQLLLDENFQLQKEVEETEREKQEKEGEITWYKAHIDEMLAFFNVYQNVVEAKNALAERLTDAEAERKDLMKK